MREGELKELSAEQRREVAAWLEANISDFPEPVRTFLALHHKYLSAGGDPRKPFDAACRELRRALGITPSSERRPSGSPRAGLPREEPTSPETEREKVEQYLGRSRRLSDWHGGLRTRHHDKAKRLEEKLTKMETDPSNIDPITEDTPVDDIELTEEQQAQSEAATNVFIEHLLLGEGADPALKSVNETLMPGGSVLATEEYVSLAATLPADMADAEVVKTLTEPRVRYDFSVAVTRIELAVEKKVVVDRDGERRVFTASTREYGPPGFSVTWSALATLAVMVGQFALPLNRLGTMLSTAGKHHDRCGTTTRHFP